MKELGICRITNTRWRMMRSFANSNVKKSKNWRKESEKGKPRPLKPLQEVSNTVPVNKLHDVNGKPFEQIVTDADVARVNAKLDQAPKDNLEEGDAFDINEGTLNDLGFPQENEHLGILNQGGPNTRNGITSSGFLFWNVMVVNCEGKILYRMGAMTMTHGDGDDAVDWVLKSLVSMFPHIQSVAKTTM